MRKSNWQTILSDMFRSAATRPFEWGVHDCCLFPCDCVLAITDKDPAAWFRGKYSTEKGAYKLLKEYAGGRLEETLIKLFAEMGYPEIGPKFAQRGDLVMCEQEGGDTLGIIGLTGRNAVVVGQEGLVLQPISTIKRAWRIE